MQFNKGDQLKKSEGIWFKLLWIRKEWTCFNKITLTTPQGLPIVSPL